jgi:hypothetical protein
MKKTPRITDEDAYLKEALEVVRAGNDYRKGNKAHDRMMITAKSIRLSHPDGGEKFFTSLLTHNELYVVSVAAFNLIPFNPKLARATYERLAKDGEGEIGFNAEMTLKEWKAGRLDPDWFMKK